MTKGGLLLGVLGVFGIKNYFDPKRAGFYVVRFFKYDICDKSVAGNYEKVTDENDPQYRRYFM